MTEMKKYLEINPLWTKILMCVLAAAAFGMGITFIAFMLGNGFEIFMLFPVFPFFLMGGFAIYSLRKSLASFGVWWNSLTELEQREIEQDFNSAVQFNSIMLLGQQYVFIRRMGCAIDYDDIEDVSFLNAQKGGWRMYISTGDGKRHMVQLPVFADRQAIWAELMNRCR